jgi:hypothetical protein
VQEDKKVAAEISAAIEREKEIMKGIPDWVIGEKIYSKRWMRPAVERKY